MWCASSSPLVERGSVVCVRWSSGGEGQCGVRPVVLWWRGAVWCVSSSSLVERGSVVCVQ